MLCVVAARIAKSQLRGSRSGLREIEVGYSPRIGFYKQKEERASSSATSIGTEENSLGVLRAAR